MLIRIFRLFLNIVVPPSFPGKRGFPVKVYIHGGYNPFSLVRLFLSEFGDTLKVFTIWITSFPQFTSSTRRCRAFRNMGQYRVSSISLWVSRQRKAKSRR